MSRRAAVMSLPDTAQLPASFVKELLAEVDSDRLDAAVERQLTIMMWRRIGTRRYLPDFPWDTDATPAPDGKWDANEIDDLGPIQLVREE